MAGGAQLLTHPNAVVRDDLHLAPGDKVAFVKVRPGEYLVLAKKRDVSGLGGMLHDAHRRRRTLEEMQGAIAVGAEDSAE